MKKQAAEVALHAIRSVPSKFWVYAEGKRGGGAVGGRDWLYGAGFLQRGGHWVR